MLWSFAGSLSASKFVIAGREIVQNELLADGGFAYVYRGADAQTGEKLAIRRVLLQEKEALCKAREEIALLEKLLPHSNIVRFLGAEIVKAEAVFLFELCTGGTLLSRLEARVATLQPSAKKVATVAGSTRAVAAVGGGQAPVEVVPSCCPCLPEAEILDILGAMSLALAQLHGMGVIHYDVKSENLLLGSDGLWKLCDFGSASETTYDFTGAERKVFFEAQEFIHGRFTPIYRPPEVADVYLRWPIGPKVDIFALGCVLFATLTGVHPFPLDSALGNIQAKFKIPPEASLAYSRALPIWVRRLLARQPSDRPSAGTLATEVNRFKESGEEPQDLVRQEHPPAPIRDSGANCSAGVSSRAGKTSNAETLDGKATFPSSSCDVTNTSLHVASDDWVADFSLAPPPPTSVDGIAHDTASSPVTETDDKAEVPCQLSAQLDDSGQFVPATVAPTTSGMDPGTSAPRAGVQQDNSSVATVTPNASEFASGITAPLSENTINCARLALASPADARDVSEASCIESTGAYKADVMVGGAGVDSTPELSPDTGTAVPKANNTCEGVLMSSEPHVECMKQPAEHADHVSNEQGNKLIHDAKAFVGCMKLEHTEHGVDVQNNSLKQDAGMNQLVEHIELGAGEENLVKQDASTLRHAGYVSGTPTPSTSCAHDGTSGESRLVMDVPSGQVPNAASLTQPVAVKPAAVEVSIATSDSTAAYAQRSAQCGPAGQKHERTQRKRRLRFPCFCNQIKVRD